MVFMSAAFAGCDKDKDKDNDNGGGGGGGNSSSTMGDYNTSFSYGFYDNDEDGDWWLYFANYDMNADLVGLSMTGLPSNLDELFIRFSASTDGDIPTGDFSDFYVAFYRTTIATGKEISFSGGTYYQPDDNIKLTISKSGDKYTVKYAGVDFYKYDGTLHQNVIAVENSTFSFTGSLAKLIVQDDDDDDE